MIKVIHCNIDQMSTVDAIHLDNPTKKTLAKAYEQAEEKGTDIVCHYDNVVNLDEHRKRLELLKKYGAR